MALRGLKFYTVKEVAEIMQVRIETVLRWIYSKKIKASKLPGSRVWRIREEDIESFMELGSNMNIEVIDGEIEIGYTDSEEVEEVAAAPVSRVAEVEEVATEKKVKEPKKEKKKDSSFSFSNSSRGRKDKVVDTIDGEIETYGEASPKKAGKIIEIEDDIITVGEPIEYDPKQVRRTFSFGSDE